jgi:hypothetical protein
MASNSPVAQKDQQSSIIRRSLEALAKGDGEGAAAAIQEIIASKKGASEAQGMRPNAWLSCGNDCQSLLGEGNAPGYGVCYWSCIADSF